MAKNPYIGTQNAPDKIAFVDPKTGNLSVVAGGNLTDYQRSMIDDFTAKGYARVDDPNAIKNLQSLTKGLQGKPNSDWVSTFQQIGASVTGPSQADIDAARNRLEAYSASKEYDKPKWGVIPNSDGTNRMVDVNSSEWKTYENNLNAIPNIGEDREYAEPEFGVIPNSEGTNRMANVNSSKSLNSLGYTPQTMLANTQKSQAVLELERARERALSGLSAEEAKVKPQFEQGRSRLRADVINQAKDFENWLATRGISGSGAVGQGMLQRGQALTAGLENSRTAEANALAELGRQRANVESDFAFGVQSAEARARELAEAQARQDAQLAEQRAYQERLTQMGWSREDAIRQSELARADALRAEELARTDALRAEELARTDALRAEETARSDFGATIAANYQDISALVNRLKASGAPQWQIDQAEAARQQKIMDLNLDPRTGQPLPVDTTPVLTSSSAALDLWKQLGTANQAIANALGVPVGSQYRNFSTGGSGSTASTGVTGLTPKETISLTESTLRGTSGNSSADIMVRMNEQGYFDNLTPSELKTLMNKFGVTELMLEQAENRATIPTQGIPLPSQMGGLYGNFNNRQ